MSEYRVRFEVFEGPLDLLLYLIRKEEVDIYEVNLTKIATEFIDYLNLMRELDLDIAGEFVVMAATLMLIKSRELLPREQRPENQGAEEDEAEDPRWELIRQLVEYRKFKDAATRMQDLEWRAENTYPRIPGRIEVPEEQPARRSEASIFDLLAAVNAVLKRYSDRKGEARDVFEDKWSVSEKIEFLLASVREKAEVRFFELFHSATSRTEVVVTFLAILELVRLRLIQARQPEPFSEITVVLAPPPGTAPAGTEAPATETATAAEPAPSHAEATPAPTSPAPQAEGVLADEPFDVASAVPSSSTEAAPPEEAGPVASSLEIPRTDGESPAGPESDESRLN